MHSALGFAFLVLQPLWPLVLPPATFALAVLSLPL